MRAQTPTKLSLYEFANLIGVHPLHFAGIDTDIPGTVHCAKPWVQHEWQQGDRTGREAVARAIAMAESRMETYLRYHLLPTWKIDEQIDGPLITKLGYVIAGGRRATTLIDADAGITYSEDAYWQKGTVTVTVDEGTDPSEVRIFYPGTAADPTWEIRPASVSIDGTTATIEFRRECAVIPEQWEALEFEAVMDGENDAFFLAAADVYRVYNDPTLGASFTYPPSGCHCSGNCNGSEQAGCLYFGDPTLGIGLARPGTWTDGEFTAGHYLNCMHPNGIKVSYLSGHRDSTGYPWANFPMDRMKRMSFQLAEAVAWFASALLERPPCDCTVDSWEYWRQDLSLTANVRYAVQAAKPNPFGTRRGAVEAWNRVQELSLGNGAVLAR